MLILCFLLVTVPWAVRNTLLHRQPTWVETSLGYNLYLGYHPQGTGTLQYGISLDLLPTLDDRERDLAFGFAEGYKDFLDRAKTEREAVREVLRLAREIGRTPSQVAIAWVRQQPRGVVVPIIGARTLGQMRDNLGCLDLTLSSEQLQRLDRVSQIEPGFPTDFLARVRGIVYGNTFDLTDDHRRRA